MRSSAIDREGRTLLDNHPLAARRGQRWRQEQTIVDPLAAQRALAAHEESRTELPQEFEPCAPRVLMTKVTR